MALARLVLLLFLSSFVVHGAKIQYTNTTVDDTDSSIRYIGSWDKSANTDLNFGGSHALSTQKTAEAFFTFTGVAVHYLAPKWPYSVSTALTLDDEPLSIVDLVDHSRPLTNGGPETVAFVPVWRRVGLENKTHSVRISVAPGGSFVILDGFIITQAVEIETKKVSAPLIAGVSVGSVVLFALICLAIWLWRRSRKTRRTGGTRPISCTSLPDIQIEPFVVDGPSRFSHLCLPNPHLETFDVIPPSCKEVSNYAVSRTRAVSDPFLSPPITPQSGSSSSIPTGSSASSPGAISKSRFFGASKFKWQGADLVDEKAPPINEIIVDSEVWPGLQTPSPLHSASSGV